MLKLGHINGICLENNQSHAIEKLLDSVVIRLESESDADLRLLDKQGTKFDSL